jgi:hypothetical protein
MPYDGTRVTDYPALTKYLEGWNEIERARGQAHKIVQPEKRPVVRLNPAADFENLEIAGIAAADHPYTLIGTPSDDAQADQKNVEKADELIRKLRADVERLVARAYADSGKLSFWKTLIGVVTMGGALLAAYGDYNKVEGWSKFVGAGVAALAALGTIVVEQISSRGGRAFLKLDKVVELRVKVEQASEALHADKNGVSAGVLKTVLQTLSDVGGSVVAYEAFLKEYR